MEPYLAKFGSGAGAEACGHIEVTSPTVQIGNSGNLQEVPVGKAATLSSKVEGADALATSWKIVRKGEGGKIESERSHVRAQDTRASATSLPYTFKHAGEYEITETVTTDNLGTPTKQVVRKITAALPAITFKIEPNADFPEGGLSRGDAGEVARLGAKDPNEPEPTSEPDVALQRRQRRRQTGSRRQRKARSQQRSNTPSPPTAAGSAS